MNSAGRPIEQSDTVTRFMKGIFHANPPTPKYDIWGPEKMLLCLNNLEKNNKPQNVTLINIILIALAIKKGYKGLFHHSQGIILFPTKTGFGLHFFCP